MPSNPCDSSIALKATINALSKKHKQLFLECEQSKYQTLSQIFGSDKAKNKDLIQVLQKYYTEQKEKDPNFKLSFNQFVELFPRDSSLSGNNFRRQHVFEQLCRILLFFGYDNGVYGKQKQFFKKLEDYHKSTDTGIKTSELLNEQINEGSRAGSVDIFFKILEDGNENTGDFYCEKSHRKNTDTDVSSNKKDTYILVQNKFYSRESTDISKYDAPKMFSRASKILEQDRFKIVLMVNSKQVLDSKLRNYDKSGIEILGIGELDEWFQKFLNDLRINEDIVFLEPDKFSSKKYLLPRFHQKLFIESTLRQYNRPGKEKRQKFIWGAVPRSGKSYIIGGFIARRINEGIKNDIVIILGAKAETEKQFSDLFTEFEDFNNYGIIKQNGKVERESKNGKYVYLMSQEFLKVNKPKLKTKEAEKNKDLKKKKKGLLSPSELEDLRNLEQDKKQLQKSKYVFDNAIIKKLSGLFANKKCDLYFDEIHKGGSTDKSKEIIQAFLKHDPNMIDVFIMVTATFAKPTIAYEDILGYHSPVVLQWNYEDQQLMKDIDTNSVNIEMLKQSRGSEIESNVFDELLKENQEQYGEDYLTVLANEYRKNPELVMINPSTIDSLKAPNYFKDRDITDTMFKLSETAVDYTSQNFEPSSIFEKSSHVSQLLKFLTDTGGLYHYLEHHISPEMKLGVFDKKPTQLWFLPITDLFNNKPTPKYPSNLLTKSGTPTKNTTEEETDVQPEDGDEKGAEGVPHIEPITRGLALAILKNPKFKDNYNVLVVHNNGKLFKASGIEENPEYKDRIKCSSQDKYKGKSLVDIIKQYETDSHGKEERKGLIILTGSKLRLGVSLPCVDIALNFDNVQSIDSNYQTMFRVLTERRDGTKKYGYYVDFNLERTKQFVYDYSVVYSNKVKKISSTEDLKSQISNIYELFNFNGISFSSDLKTTAKMYQELMVTLGLDDSNLKKMYLENYERTFGKILLKYDLSNFKEISPLVKGIFSGKDDKVSVKEKGSNKTGAEKFEHEPRPGPKPHEEVEPGGGEVTPEEPKKPEEEEDSIKIVKALKKLIPAIVALLAIFSDNSAKNTNNDYKCSSLEECFDESVKRVTELRELCSCETPRKHPIACYISKFKKISTENLKKVLKNLKKNIFEQRELEEVKKHLIILYDSIRSDFKMSGGYSNTNYLKNTKKIYRGGSRETNNTRSSKKLIHKMTAQDISNKISTYLPIRSEMKDKFGEVFTPKELIEEMMNKLREIDPSVFKNPHLRWLDPANGTGNFPMVVFEMLNDGLKDYNKEDLDLRDEKTRKNHIIKNMLYMVELQPDNVLVSQKIFGKDANIFCGSFLPKKEGDSPIWLGFFKDTKTGVPIEKFDIIMGNPPYQQKNSKGQTINSNKKLYADFIGKSLDVIKNNGYLLFVIPNNFFSGKNNKFYTNIIQNELLVINNDKITSKYFPNVGQDILYFIMKNKIKDKTQPFFTNVIFNSLNNKINIRDIEINPINYWNEHTENIFIKLINDTKFEDIKYTRNGEPDVNTNVLVLNQIDWRIDPVLEFKNNVTQNNFYYISTDENMKKLYTFFMSPLYKFVNIVSKTSKYRKNPKYINLQKILSRTEKITFDSIYNIFNINKTEQKIINKVIEILSTKKTYSKPVSKTEELTSKMTSKSTSSPKTAKVNSKVPSKPPSPPKTVKITSRTAKVTSKVPSKAPSAPKTGTTFKYVPYENKELKGALKIDGVTDTFGPEDEKKALCSKMPECTGLLGNKTSKKFKLRKGKKLMDSPGKYTLKKETV